MSITVKNLPEKVTQAQANQLPSVLKDNYADAIDMADSDTKTEIAANGYDLSLNRYKEVIHETVEHESPKKILTRLAKLEDEIAKGRKELEGLLG